MIRLKNLASINLAINDGALLGFVMVMAFPPIVGVASNWGGGRGRCK